MALRKQDGYIILDAEMPAGEPVLSEDLKKLFLPDWLRAALANSQPEDAQAFESAYWAQVAQSLKQLSESPQNWLDRGVPVGASNIKIGNKSVPVKELFLVGLSYSLPAYIAIGAFVAGPAGLLVTAKAAAAIAPIAGKYYAAVNTYSPTELDVHTAVVAAITKKANLVLKADGATFEEIEASFADLSLIQPRNLKAVLDDMASDKKRMLLRSVAGGVEAYRPNPL
jgi:hypothetical protein